MSEVKDYDLAMTNVKDSSNFSSIAPASPTSCEEALEKI